MDAITQVPAGDHFIDQAPGERGLGVENTAADQKVHITMLADSTRQRNAAARPRNESETNFWQTNSHVISRNDRSCEGRQFNASAKTSAVDSGNYSRRDIVDGER
jgi:hypothetical protein